MKAEQIGPVGSLKISRDVIAAIAIQAAKEIEGVYGVGQNPVDLKGLFSRDLKSTSFRPVSIRLGDDTAEIDLRVVLRGDAHIPTVSSRVQENVKDSVQNMTGITVSKVNVVIAEAHFENNKELR